MTEMKMKPLTSIIVERRWQWLEHVLRLTSNSLPNKISPKWIPQGKRSKEVEGDNREDAEQWRAHLGKR